MNLKVLGKAMGFMFLPTLGVLLMLIVGFFDPIAMWNWIKSDAGWAIATRIILFVVEIGLVVVLYYQYLDEEIKKNAMAGNYPKTKGYTARYTSELRDILNGHSDDTYKVYNTESSNIKLIELIVK